MQKGPSLTVRFESKRQLESLKKAAKSDGRSLNSFIVRQLSAITKEQSQQQTSVTQ